MVILLAEIIRKSYLSLSSCCIKQFRPNLMVAQNKMYLLEKRGVTIATHDPEHRTIHGWRGLRISPGLRRINERYRASGYFSVSAWPAVRSDFKFFPRGKISASGTILHVVLFLGRYRIHNFVWFAVNKGNALKFGSLDRVACILRTRGVFKYIQSFWKNKKTIEMIEICNSGGSSQDVIVWIISYYIYRATPICTQIIQSFHKQWCLRALFYMEIN